MIYSSEVKAFHRTAIRICQQQKQPILKLKSYLPEKITKLNHRIDKSIEKVLYFHISVSLSKNTTGKMACNIEFGRIQPNFIGMMYGW